MAQPQKPGTPTTSKPATAPAPAAKPNGNGMSAAKAKGDGKEKRAKVRWASPQDKSYWVRSYKDITDKHGAPKDPWGNTMVPSSGNAGGVSALKQAREEREAKLAAMTEEQRVSFLKTEKEQRKANKAAKKQAEYEAIVAKVKADLAAGKLT